MKALFILLLLPTIAFGQKQLTISTTVKGYVVMDSAAFKKQTDSLRGHARAEAAKIFRDSLFTLKRVQAVRETPAGVIDSVNKVFRLAAAPIKESEQVYADDKFLRPLADYSITLDGKVTLKVAPLRWVFVLYQKYVQ